ncbi:MAG: EAL domain-containing protein [Thiotrichales bacterium]|nr:EAL domain-containing protein [Thiotrichales bacterium]
MEIWSQSEQTQHLTIAVNISEHQLRREDFVTTVTQQIQTHQFNPNRLELEITESILMTDLDSSITKIKKLRKQGVTFAIDDFGTGYSSLNYLKKLPIDWLKIDQSFVRDMLNNKQDEAIVKTILALSKTMGLTTIAEGVETEQQRDFLIKLGCPIMQGYLFDKPKRLEDLNYEQHP